MAAMISSNYDEVSMHQSLVFSDCLKDLRNLRTQLYSAAEYFEYSYKNDDQKQILMCTLLDYAIKALVNTVDHLGSVTYKVDDLLNEKIADATATDLRVSSIEQRIQTCQEYIDRAGFAQQSLIISAPKYHKRCMLRAGETRDGTNGTKSKYEGCSPDGEDDWHRLRNAVRATMRETPPSPSAGKAKAAASSPSPSPKPFKRLATFSFSSKNTPKKEQDKRSESPHRVPLTRSGSVAGRSTTPSYTRTNTIKDSNEPRKLFPGQPLKSSMSMLVRSERESTAKDHTDQQQHSAGKGKRILKSLLSRRKSKKDDTLYTYLDEY